MSLEQITIYKKKLQKQLQGVTQKLSNLNQEQIQAKQDININNNHPQEIHQVVEVGDCSESYNKSFTNIQNVSSTDQSINQLSEAIHDNSIQLLNKGKHFKKSIQNQNQQDVFLQIKKFFQTKKIVLTKYLTSGGEGDIFEGYTDNHQDIIFKIQMNQKEEFDEEISIHKSIQNHVNVVKMIDYFAMEEQGLYIFVLEKCVHTLLFELETLKQIDEDHLFQIFFDLLDGIIEMRSNKIIHSDIKPSNILKTLKNTYCYTDFGCASKKTELNKNHQFKGYTVKYASPEAISSKIDYKSDIFSLGQTFKKILEIYKSKSQQSNLEIISQLQKIIDEKMIQNEIDERENCLNILLLIYRKVAQIKNFKFLQSYQKKIQQMLKEYPFSNEKDNRFYQQVYLNYNLINLHIQFIPLYVQLDLTAQSLIALLTENCYYEYYYYFQRNQSSIVDSLQNIGKTLNNLGQPLLALEYLKKADQINRIQFLSSQRNLIQSLRSQEQLYILQKNIDRANQMNQIYSNILITFFGQKEKKVTDKKSIDFQQKQDINMYHIQCYLEQTLEKYNENFRNINPLIFNYIYSLIQFYKSSGEFEIALNLHQRFYNNKIVFQNPTFEINYLISIAEVYYNLNEYQIAKEIYDRLIMKCQKKDQLLEEYSNILYHLGFINYRSQEFNQAIEFFNLSLQIKDELSQEEREVNAKSYHMLGLICMSEKNYLESEENLMKSLKIREKIILSQKMKLIITNKDIGHVYFAQQDFKKALMYYVDSLTYAMEIDDINCEFICECTFAVGQTYFEMRQFEHAIKYLNQCLETSKIVQNLKYIALSLSTIANCYNILGDAILTEQYMKESIEILVDTNSTLHPDIATYSQNLGVFYLKNRQYDKALNYLKNCYKIRKIYYDGFHQKKIEILQNMIDLYEAQGDAQRKEKYHNQLQNSISQLAKFMQIFEFYFQLQLRKLIKIYSQIIKKIVYKVKHFEFIMKKYTNHPFSSLFNYKEQIGQNQLNNEDEDEEEANQVSQFQQQERIQLYINSHVLFDLMEMKQFYSQFINLTTLTLDIQTSNISNKNLYSLFDGFKFLSNLNNLSVSFNNKLLVEEGNTINFSCFFKHLTKLSRLQIILGSKNITNSLELLDFAINLQYLKNLQQLSLIIEEDPLIKDSFLQTIYNGIKRIDNLKALKIIINMDYKYGFGQSLQQIKNEFQEIQRLYFRFCHKRLIIGKDKQKQISNLNPIKENFKKTIQIDRMYLKSNESLFNKKRSICLNDNITHLDYFNFKTQLAAMLNLNMYEVQINYLKNDEKFFMAEENNNNYIESHSKLSTSELTPLLRCLTEISISIYQQNKFDSLQISQYFNKFQNLFALKLVLHISNDNNQGITGLFEGISNISNLIALEFILMDEHITQQNQRDNSIFFEIDSFKYIEKDFKRLINLKQLNFKIGQKILIDSEGVIAISKGLIHLKNLENLEIHILENNGINTQGVIGLGESLKSLNKLQSLSITLKQNKFDYEGIKSLGEGISQQQILSELNLTIEQQEEFRSEVFQELFQGIQNLFNLKKLSLSINKSNDVDSRGVEVIQKCFSKLINLQNVSLTASHIYEIINLNSKTNSLYFIILNELKKTNQLTHFKLNLDRGVIYTDYLVTKLQECIQDQIHLIDLSIIYHVDNIKSLKFLSKGISNLSNLQYLTLDFSYFYDSASWHTFCIQMQKLSLLTRLTLNIQFTGIHVDIGGTNKLAETLKKLSNLTYLSLRLIPKKFEESEQLINKILSAIFNLTNLIELELILNSNNYPMQINIGQFKKLGKLFNIKNLKLVLGSDKFIFENKEALELAKVISSFVTLNKLYLDINSLLETQGVKSIGQGLKQLTNLQKLKLKINIINEQDLKELKNDLKQLKNLNKFTLIINKNNMRESMSSIQNNKYLQSSDSYQLNLDNFDLKNYNVVQDQLVKLNKVTQIKYDLQKLYNFNFGNNLNFDLENKNICLRLSELLNCKILINDLVQGCQESLDILYQKFKTLKIVINEEIHINSESISKLCKNLKVFSFIQHFQIDILYYQISTEGAIGIRNGLSNLQNLISLKITINDDLLQTQGLIEIGNGLKKLTKLKSLIIKLGKKSIGDEDLIGLAQGIKSLNNLTVMQLKMKFKYISSDGVEEFMQDSFQYLANLKELLIVFETKNIDDTFIKAFTEGFQYLKSIINFQFKIISNDIDSVYIDSRDGFQSEFFYEDISDSNSKEQGEDFQEMRTISNGCSKNNISCESIEDLENQFNLSQKSQKYNYQFGRQEYNQLFEGQEYNQQLEGQENNQYLDGQEQNQQLVGQVFNQQFTGQEYNQQQLGQEYNQQLEGQKYNSQGIIIGNNFKYLTNLVNLTFTIKQMDVIENINLRAIAEGFKYLINLQYLNWSIQERYTLYKGVGDIGQGIKQLKQLINLSLQIKENHIKEEGFQEICQGISQLENLQTLKCKIQGGNYIRNKGAIVLFTNIKDLTNLNDFTFVYGGNKITEYGAKSIAQQIQMLRKLSQFEFKIYNNNIGREGAEELKKATLLYAQTYCLQNQKFSFEDEQNVYFYGIESNFQKDL